MTITFGDVLSGKTGAERLVRIGLEDSVPNLVLIARDRLIPIIGERGATDFVVRQINNMIAENSFSFGRDDDGNYIW